MSNFLNQNFQRTKNLEVTSRKIFDIKIKTNDFNYVILNELNGFQSIYYLKNKKLHQLFLKTKKKQELEILKNYEIIYLDTNLNHDSLICITSNGSIFSINYEAHKIIYFSNLDFNKFIIPNLISSKKRSLSFSRKNSNKMNSFENLNQIINIYCNNSSDKIVLNLNKYILFWYQSNYNLKNNNDNKFEIVSGTIYSLIKDNELEKCGIMNNPKNKVINLTSNNNIIGEGVTAIFANNYFLGSHTRIFYIVVASSDNNFQNKKCERQIYIMDYLFKFNYKDRFRCISEVPKNDYFYTDAFNGSENEDLNDIKSKISTTTIIFNNLYFNNNKNKKEDNNNDNHKPNNLIIKGNTKGDVIAIIINDDLNNLNIFNNNSTLIFFMSESYKFYKKAIVDIIGTKLLSNKGSKIEFTEMDWICNDMFLLILSSKGYFFLININFQLISISDISKSIISFDSYYISSFFENNKKNKTNNFKLFASKQREDIFMIYNNEYIICYQINYKMLENKIITTEISPENFSHFLFLLKYFQLYLPNTQIDYLPEDELNLLVINIMHKYLQGLFNKVKDNIPLQNGENEIIKTETGIKIMKTKQNDSDSIHQESIIGDDNDLGQKNKNDFDKSKTNNLLIKSETNNNLLKNIVRYIQIFRSLNQVHEKNLTLITFLIGKSTDFLIHLINHKEIWLAVLYLELCEKYLCSQLLLFQNIGENIYKNKEEKNISLSKIVFKSKDNNIYNSERFMPYFFDTFQNYQKSPINKGIYIRMRILLLFFCLIEFRNNFALNINVLFFVLAKLIIEKIKQKNMLDDIYNITKVIIKNFKYLKQENEKAGKDEFVLSSLSMSYRNEFFSDLKITKTERDDINFDFFAEFYTIDDFVSFTEPTENFCKTDDLYLLSEFNYLNNTGMLQKWVILMTNYLYYELFQDIKKYMENHLRQVKDKSEANTSPEEKNLNKLVFFNMVFILLYIQNFLRNLILFLTQKESSNDKYKNFGNNDYNAEENVDKYEINNIDNNNNSQNNEEENEYQDNFIHYSEKIQEDFNKILFKSISPIDVPFIIFTFYIYETNPNNRSKAYDINRELAKRIIRNSRKCLLSVDDLLELIEFIHLNGFNYINNNINNNTMISQIEPKERLQNSIFTSFLFYFFVLHKLNLIYLLETDLNLIYEVLDSLNLNQRRQLYELILIITNGTLKYFLKMQFNQKISPVEGKYLEILLSFYKIIFYKMVREESCIVRKNIADCVHISPSIMSSYLLEGSLYYEYKNCNKICKNIIGLDKIILNNINLSKKNENKVKIPNYISIFEILYGLSGMQNNNNDNFNINSYGKDKKIYKQIVMILFNNDKILSKQFLILLNNLTKLLQLKPQSNNYIKYSSSEYLIFKFENDLNYVMELILSKIVNNKQKNIYENIDEEDDISNNIFNAIDLIIKGNFDDRTLFKFNNNDTKTKLVRNLKLIISKILHLLYEIQIKINLLLFEDKGNIESKINYLNLLSQALLCENNPKIIQKLVKDLFIFIKLLNIKNIMKSSTKENNIIKNKLKNIIKNIEIAIIMNFNADYEKKTISNILGEIGYKLTDIINFNDISNLGKTITQIKSNILKKFLFYSGIGVPNYLENLKLIYNDLVILIKTRPSEKLLIRARRQYIQLSDSFYNLVGIPQKSFIEFIINWDLVEKEQLYQSIIEDEMDDHLYSEEKTGIVLNKRQVTGKETPRKTRKNSVSKYKENNKRHILSKKNNINKDKVTEDNNIENENFNVDKDSEIKYYKNTLKIKKQNDVCLSSINIYEKNLIYFKNTVRKLIFNRFINNLFIGIKNIERDDNNSFKIYSISQNLEKGKEESKNIEVILLNPIYIVFIIFIIYYLLLYRQLEIKKLLKKQIFLEI